MKNTAAPNGRNLAVLLIGVLIIGLAFVVVTKLMGAGSASQQTGAVVTPQTYPKMGHAPDYSWIAGQVAFTRIQGGCTFIRTAPAPASESTPQPNANTPGAAIVGTAVHSDVSPPLRDITPAQATQEEPVGDSFTPGGPGWDPSKVKNGDYVVLFGHLAGPDEPREICPGGRAYVADTMQLNP